ncbi:MAG: TetR/AcrR family transcriptional regulator [Firmicutes bacterium]|nr:TetR/AcrR family transcriptional regulator [Bacillota bacterium]
MNISNNKKRKSSVEKIEKTFLQLIQKKNIEEISVSTICKIAGLNRSTFYSNYIDIYDLAEKVKQQMEIEFARFQLSNNSKQNPDGYLNMFKYIKDNQIFFKTYFKLESISLNIPAQYRIELAEKYYDNKYIDYHIEFFRSGLNAVIKKWLNNGCKETPEEINEIIISEYKNKN